MKKKARPSAAKLEVLALSMREAYAEACNWDGEEDWENHAYHRSWSDGTEGCWHCMARDALGEGPP